ncbi:MAG: Tfp pilus assembly protein PilO, partial [Thermoproteota archaeon]
MSSIQNMFLRLLPYMIMGYASWSFLMYFEEHQEKLESRISRIEGITSKITISERKIKKIQQFRKNLEESKLRIKEVSGQIAKVQKQLPTNVNDTVVLDFLQNEASFINMKKVELAPLGEKPKGFYISKNYSYKAEGTYLQFLIFFERLANSERLFNVKKLVLRSEGVKQKGRFTLIQCETVLESYKYNEAHVEDTGIDEIE